MPTYEYQCKACGVEFERFQQISEEPITECPECSGPVKKLISAGAGFIFKGSGFYITDYRSEGYKQAEKKDTEKKTDSDTTSKTDTTSKKDTTSKSETTSKKDAKDK